MSTKPMERVDANKLSMKDFIEKYAKKRIPVIIYNLKMFQGNVWDEEYLKKVCGNKTIKTKVINQKEEKDLPKTYAIIHTKQQRFMPDIKKITNLI